MAEVYQTAHPEIPAVLIAWHPQNRPWPKPADVKGKDGRSVQDQIDEHGHNPHPFAWDPERPESANQLKQMQRHHMLKDNQGAKDRVVDVRGNAVKPGGVALVTADFLTGDHRYEKGKPAAGRGGLHGSGDFHVLTADVAKKHLPGGPVVYNQKTRLVYRVENLSA